MSSASMNAAEGTAMNEMRIRQEDLEDKLRSYVSEERTIAASLLNLSDTNRRLRTENATLLETLRKLQASTVHPKEEKRDGHFTSPLSRATDTFSTSGLDTLIDQIVDCVDRGERSLATKTERVGMSCPTSDESVLRDNFESDRDMHVVADTEARSVGRLGRHVDEVELLWRIFAKYALLQNDRSTITGPNISYDAWIAFMVDCELLDSEDEEGRKHAGLIYARATKRSSHGQIGSMRSFMQFVRSIELLHDQRRGKGVEQMEDKYYVMSVALFLRQHIFPPRFAKRWPVILLNRFDASTAVRQLRSEMESSVRGLFGHYSKSVGVITSLDWTRFTVDFDFMQLFHPSELAWAFWHVLGDEFLRPLDIRRPLSEQLSGAIESNALPLSRIWSVLAVCVSFLSKRINEARKVAYRRAYDSHHDESSEDDDLAAHFRALLLWMYLILQSRSNEGESAVLGTSRHVTSMTNSFSTSASSIGDLSVQRAAIDFSRNFSRDWKENGYTDYSLYSVIQK